MIKVYDGVVLATDSASSLALPGGGFQVYNNANKIFHLHRRYPVSAMTWGLGNVGTASIATLAKDLRRRLMGRDASHQDWSLDEAYTVESVARRLVEHVHPLYSAEHPGPPDPKLILGMLVAGYSGHAGGAEAWQITFNDPSVVPDPVLIAAEDSSGWAAFAQPAATQRLFWGFDPGLPGMIQAQLDPVDWAKVEHLLRSDGPAARSPTHPAMPLGDAIALGRYLAETTAGYTHFLMGADTVGGPVEVATISRHEGFKWISRKHYFGTELNPEESDHAY